MYIEGTCMKKIIITLLFIIPFLSGCAKVNTNLTINNDKSAQVEVKMLSLPSARPLELATMSANVDNFINKSYDIKNNSSLKNIDIVAKKSVKNLFKEDLDLSSLGFITKHESGRFIDVKHNFFVTSYNIHLIYKFPESEKKVILVKDLKPVVKDGLQPEYFQKYADANLIPDVDNVGKADFIANFDQNLISEEEIANYKTKEVVVDDDYKLFDINNFNSAFSIILPSFASYNNAQKVNGNMYTWQISKTEPTEIILQYVVYNSFAISFVLLICIAGLIYLARRIYKHEAQKRIGNNN